MGQILIRSIPDSAKSALRERAVQNGRSMEAEARSILIEAVYVHAQDPVMNWLREAEKIREHGLATTLPTPDRQPSRQVDPL